MSGDCTVRPAPFTSGQIWGRCIANILPGGFAVSASMFNTTKYNIGRGFNNACNVNIYFDVLNSIDTLII